MNWGYKIILGYVLFATFVFTLVFKMITSGNDLVKTKYFRTAKQINEDIRLQETSVELSRHTRIHQVMGQSDVLEIRFEAAKGDITGNVQFICLSDDRADQHLLLQPQADGPDKVQKIKLLRPKSGTWLCEMEGTHDKKPFLIKRQMVL